MPKILIFIVSFYLSRLNGQPSNQTYKGNCNFELDTCSWTNLHGKDDFDWLRTSGQTTTRQTGPSTDHTAHNRTTGTYLYIESSAPRRPGDVAVLQSVMFPPSSGMCFSFWYHMYGKTIGTLRALLKKEQSNAKSIWELSGNQGNTWFQGKVPIDSSSSQWQILMDGIKGNGIQGDIAIDDLTISQTSCQIVPIQAMPTTPAPPTTTATSTTPAPSTTNYVSFGVTTRKTYGVPCASKQECKDTLICSTNCTCVGTHYWTGSTCTANPDVPTIELVSSTMHTITIRITKGEGRVTSYNVKINGTIHNNYTNYQAESQILTIPGLPGKLYQIAVSAVYQNVVGNQSTVLKCSTRSYQAITGDKTKLVGAVIGSIIGSVFTTTVAFVIFIRCRKVRTRKTNADMSAQYKDIGSVRDENEQLYICSSKK